MIERLLPSAVIAVEAFGDLPELFDFAAEKRLVAGAVEERRREFLTARRCAHEALLRMGVTPIPIGSGEDHAPVWPAGLVGSITHCENYRAAAVARQSEIASVGIDAEINRPLPAGVGDVVLCAEEWSQLDSSPPASTVLHWDRLFFSCKEAAYKAWYPLTGRWLDFTDVKVVLDSVNHEFSAHVHVNEPHTDSTPPPCFFHGRYTASAQLIVAAVTVRSDDHTNHDARPP
jgi:4'-phosphopantetheinyl transferase EntD